MEKKYDNIAESEEMACEPLGGSAAAIESEEPMKMLDSDIIGMALEIALIAERRGDLIPVDEAFDSIFKEMGWK